MELHERIKYVRTQLNMSQKVFGEHLGVSRDVIANIEYARVSPPKIFIQHLCSTFCVNLEWLDTDQGSVFIHENKNLSETIRIFNDLTPDLQEYAFQQMKSLLQLQNKLQGKDSDK
jgi:transcriptional regulator with XRE-family HTH domain